MTRRWLVAIVVAATIGWIVQDESRHLQSATSPTPCPSKVAVTLPDGAVIIAEVADTHKRRARGLSGRDSLEPNSGMLFVFPAPGIYPFWMKDTRFPLDIVWLRDTAVVEHVSLAADSAANTPRHDPSEPATDVLELPAGSLVKHAIVKGSKISWPHCRSRD